MEGSQACIDLIKKYEGLRLKAYLCPAKIWTIGYGYTRNVQEGDIITEEDAVHLLKFSLSDIMKELSALCSMKGIELEQYELDALLSFIYNVGFKAFADSTLFKKLVRGDKAGAADEFKKWVRGGGRVLPGLVKRRADEEALFRGGKV